MATHLYQHMIQTKTDLIHGHQGICWRWQVFIYRTLEFLNFIVEMIIKVLDCYATVVTGNICCNKWKNQIRNKTNILTLLLMESKIEHYWWGEPIFLREILVKLVFHWVLLIMRIKKNVPVSFEVKFCHGFHREAKGNILHLMKWQGLYIKDQHYLVIISTN